MSAASASANLRSVPSIADVRLPLEKTAMMELDELRPHQGRKWSSDPELTRLVSEL
jgi:hypothetical protein